MTSDHSDLPLNYFYYIEDIVHDVLGEPTSYNAQTFYVLRRLFMCLENIHKSADFSKENLFKPKDINQSFLGMFIN